jgi:hypothetical protein
LYIADKFYTFVLLSVKQKRQVCLNIDIKN